MLGFYIKKCKVVSYGNIAHEWEYEMTDIQYDSHRLETLDSEPVLGILFKKNLKFDEHIVSTVNKLSRIIGLIRRTFTHMDKICT